MASLVKKPNGKWLAMVRRSGHPQQSKIFATKRDAGIWARDLERSWDMGLNLDYGLARRTKLKVLVERYRDEISPTMRGHESQSGHISTILKDPVCNVNIGDLTDMSFNGFIERQEKSRYAPDTIIRRVNLFHRIIEIGRKKWGYRLAVNPVAGVERPSASKGRTRRLMEGEEERLLSICLSKDKRLWALTALDLEAGLREAEIVLLDWKQVNPCQRKIDLTKTKNDEDRSVPLSRRAIKILKTLPKPRTGRLFPWGVNQFKVMFGRMLREYGFDNLRFHDLRHEAVSRIYERTDLRDIEIARMFGHKTLVMTKRYAHLDTRKVAKRLG